MTDETRTLGRTGLKVSLLGLGAGGNSRLGLTLGQDEAHAVDVVRAALDMGITMIDTARGYQTERAVGQALRGWRRDRVVVSSKCFYKDEQNELLTPQAFAEGIETSLQELGLETIDIYFIHGLRLSYYESCLERFLPVLEDARRAGKIRFIGVTEAFESDTGHEMLKRAVQDHCWDVMMVGFNLLNPSARQRVLPYTQSKGIGTLGMFAVRRALIGESWLRTLLLRMAEAVVLGKTAVVDPALATAPDLFAALGLKGVSESLSEAAYRFAAYEPGLDCVLSGTSNANHLSDNLQAIQRGPLPPATITHLAELFGKVDGFSGQVHL